MSFTSVGFQQERRQSGKGGLSSLLRAGRRAGRASGRALNSTARSVGRRAANAGRKGRSYAKRGANKAKKRLGRTKLGQKASAGVKKAGGKRKLLKKVAIGTGVALAPELAMMGATYAFNRNSDTPITPGDMKKVALSAGSTILKDGLQGNVGAKRTARTVHSSWNKMLNNKINSMTPGARRQQLQNSIAQQNARYSKYYRMYNNYARRSAGHNRPFGTGRKMKGKKKKKKKKKTTTRKKRRYTTMNIPAAIARRNNQLRNIMRPA